MEVGDPKSGTVTHTILRPFEFAGPHGLDPHKDGEPPAPTDPDFLFSVIIVSPIVFLTIVGSWRFFETEKNLVLLVQTSF